MRLLHYTAKPFTFDPSLSFKQVGHYAGGKPSGLWLSVEGDGDWKEWCEGEQWGLERLKHVSEITLKPHANVLTVDTLAKLDRFSKDFKAGGDPVVELRYIDWPRVKNLWDGIIIAPYQWNRRHDFMWYYGWDCASGVIWNLSAIAGVKALEPEPCGDGG